uniref:Dynein light chain 1 n=1 Tax=Schistocephalus solidus TaxID=70667 RepID=A0A0V0JAS5_SCHSO
MRTSATLCAKCLTGRGPCAPSGKSYFATNGCLLQLPSHRRGSPRTRAPAYMQHTLLCTGKTNEVLWRNLAIFVKCFQVCDTHPSPTSTLWRDMRLASLTLSALVI